MSFIDDLKKISSSPTGMSNIYPTDDSSFSQIDSIVIQKVNDIKNDCRIKAANGFFVYNTDRRKKTIYGKIDLLRFSMSYDGLYSTMYENQCDHTIRLNETGLNVFKRLQTACLSDSIHIKFGRKPPSGDKPDQLKDWYNNSLYDEASSSLTIESPYHAQIGYKIELPMTQEEIDNRKNNSSGCYIATCVYGSYDCPEVWTLRRFRDFKLAETWHGRMFISVYYAISPTIVQKFGNITLFKKLCRIPLNCFVQKLRQNGYSDFPYEDNN